MSKTPKAAKPFEEEPEDVKALATDQQREAVIRAGVLAVLGCPTRLLRVAVMPLWGNNFRVNVLIGEDATAVMIPNSYFVTADDRGNILATTPPIQKQY